ncbi:hypothetical protein M5689_007442 [Euphorbia peplus]|nr:hypothetical protein M5689_007442 [Euphorbia peplus]
MKAFLIICIILLAASFLIIPSPTIARHLPESAGGGDGNGKEGEVVILKEDGVVSGDGAKSGKANKACCSKGKNTKCCSPYNPNC